MSACFNMFVRCLAITITGVCCFFPNLRIIKNLVLIHNPFLSVSPTIIVNTEKCGIWWIRKLNDITQNKPNFNQKEVPFMSQESKFWQNDKKTCTSWRSVRMVFVQNQCKKLCINTNNVVFSIWLNVLWAKTVY